MDEPDSPFAALATSLPLPASSMAALAETWTWPYSSVAALAADSPCVAPTFPRDHDGGHATVPESAPMKAWLTPATRDVFCVVAGDVSAAADKKRRAA